MFRRAIVCSFFLFVFQPAFAWKEVSGGNGIGGTLADRSVYELGESLGYFDLFEVYGDELKPIFMRFPHLYVLMEATYFGRGSKAVYLEDRELNPACKNALTISAETEIWACQNDVEIRIKRSWWEKASVQLKADLLLHEALTSYGLKFGKTEAVPRAFYLLRHSNAQDVEVQLGFHQLDLFPLLTTHEVRSVVERFALFLEKICRFDLDRTTDREVREMVLSEGFSFTNRSEVDGVVGKFYLEVIDEVSEKPAAFLGRNNCGLKIDFIRRKVHRAFQTKYLVGK